MRNCFILKSLFYLTLVFALWSSSAHASCWFSAGGCRYGDGTFASDLTYVLGSGGSVGYKCCTGGPGNCTADYQFTHGVSTYTCDNYTPLASTATLSACPITKSGSIIRADDQTVLEQVPVIGTPFNLVYASHRQDGYTANKIISIPIYGSTSSDSISASAAISIGNQSSTTNYPTPTDDTNQPFTWNGLNSSSTPVNGSQNLHIDITYASNPASIPSDNFVVPDNRGPIDMPLGDRLAKFDGLGGWEISVHHFYNSVKQTLDRGDGSTEPVIADALVGGGFRVVSGNEVYIFDANGNHLQTKTFLTGATKLTFAYTGTGALSSITDDASNVTTITYSSGVPTQITAPYGQITSLSLNTDNLLQSIGVPGVGTFAATYYGAGGLLATFTKPSGEVSSFSFDTLGRLTSDVSTSGVSTSLTRTDVSPTYWNIVAQSALGRSQNFSIQQSQDSYGTRADRTFTNESGRSVTSTYDPQSVYNSVGRTSWSSYPSADPRFPNSSYESSGSLQTGSFTRSTSTTKTASLNSADPFDINSLTETTHVNTAPNWSSVYSGSTKKFTLTSPVGRVATRTIDATERTTQTKDASFAAVNYTYDTHGRLSTISQNTRTSTLGYNSAGFLNSITDPMLQVTSMTYDTAGRILTTTLPDSRVITYTYDLSGNVTSVTPPSTSAHSFTNNLMNFPTQYQAPSLGSGTLNTSYVYSNDRELTQMTRPSGAVIDFAYDPTTGLLATVSSGAATFTYIYNDYDRINEITSPDSATIDFSYSGDLVTSAEYSSAAKGKVTFGYDNLLHRTSFQIGTGTAYAWAYDNDELLNHVGSETINRSSTSGRVSDTSVGNAKEYYTYDSTYGELASYQAKYTTSTNKILESYTRDANGRIATRTVTIGTGAADVFAYTYDTAGRLTDVTKNAASVGHYVYDANSNRTSSTNSGGTFAATYDAEDRLSTYGTKTFGYSLNGERTSQVDTSTSPTTTSYIWDAFGNLKQVTLPSTTQIKYQYDGLNRKVTKLTGSTVNERYVYLDQTKLLGVLNSSGATVMTFFYGVRGTPEYMIKSGTTYKFFVDHVGSVRQVINTSTGVVSQELTYDEFGRVLTDSSPGFQPFGFAGGLYDSATGLTQFGARWYDAQVGRWLSKDGILFGSTIPSNAVSFIPKPSPTRDVNLYNYVMSDPVNFTDSTGYLTDADYAQARKNAGKGAIGGVCGGAVVGTVVPGVGTGTGALVGGTLGLVGGYVGTLLRASLRDMQTDMDQINVVP